MPVHRVPVDALERTVLELERSGHEVKLFAVHGDDALILTRERLEVRATVAAQNYGRRA
jgi:hypothetical protein